MTATTRPLPPIRRALGCIRCGNNNWDDRKYTQYTYACGLSPLCNACWNGLTPERRMIFYDLLLEWWREDGWDGAEYDAIRKAVLEGR